MDKSYTIGALVGRFQVHELREAHHYLIDQVVKNHKKVIPFPINKAELQDVEFGFITFSDRSFIIADETDLQKITRFIYEQGIKLEEVE